MFEVGREKAGRGDEGREPSGDSRVNRFPLGLTPSPALSSLLVALVLTAGGFTGSGGDQAWASKTVFSANDNQAPTVTIASPAAGATLGGTVTVSGSASDNVSLSKVELRVDGNAYQLASGTTSWTFSLNTSAYASGSHTLLARATDASGNQAWASRTVTFSSGTDNQAPTVAIASPAAGATLGGTVSVSGSASDNVSLSKVELRVDGNAYQLASGTTLLDVLAEHERLRERQPHAARQGDRCLR